LGIDASPASTADCRRNEAFQPNFASADRRRISAPALGNGLNETGKAIPGVNVIFSGGSGSS
jgi:hypothetical protein